MATSTKTKKITSSAALPSLGERVALVADPSTGEVRTVTAQALASELGDLVGVQTASYNVSGPGWVRLASIGCNAATVHVSHIYGGTPANACVLLVGGCYTFNTLTDPGTVKMVGNPGIFDKARLVGKGNEVYLEVHSGIEERRSNLWYVSMTSSRPKSGNCQLYRSKTAGEVPDGYNTKEFTLAEMKNWGG